MGVGGIEAIVYKGISKVYNETSRCAGYAHRISWKYQGVNRRLRYSPHVRGRVF